MNFLDIMITSSQYFLKKVWGQDRTRQERMPLLAKTFHMRSGSGTRSDKIKRLSWLWTRHVVITQLFSFDRQEKIGRPLESPLYLHEPLHAEDRVVMVAPFLSMGPIMCAHQYNTFPLFRSHAR